MPSVLTHYGFNKEMFNNKLEFLKDNEDIFLVASQGPDPFFFYGLIPFLGKKNKSDIRNLGGRLHKMDPFRCFEVLFDYCDESNQKDVLYAYVLGMGMHYILDRKIHPYVYYKTGFSDDKKMKKLYFADHTLFETNIDVLLMNNKYRDFRVRPLDSLECQEDKIRVVSRMYKVLVDKIFGDVLVDDDVFKDVYDHMCMIEKILYSGKGVKKRIVGVMAKNTPLNTMMHPLSVKDDNSIDYLNLKKNKWNDPSTGECYYKSFYDLLDEAKEDAFCWIDIVKRRYEGESVDLKGFTKGFIYDGYVEGSKMKKFESVYRKGEEINDY